MLWTSLLEPLLLHRISFSMLCFHFHLSQDIFWFPFWFLLWPTDCLGVCKLPHSGIFQISSLLISSFIPLWLEKIMISNFLNLLRLVLQPSIKSTLENVPSVLEKNMYFTAVGWNVLYVPVRSIWSTGLFKSYISLLIFCLNVLLLKVGYWSILPLLCCCLFLPSVLSMFALYFFIHLGALMLSVHIFIIIISSWWIKPSIIILGWPKSSFGFFHKVLWKNPNKLFGQPDTMSTFVFCDNFWLKVYFVSCK